MTKTHCRLATLHCFAVASIEASTPIKSYKRTCAHRNCVVLLQLQMVLSDLVMQVAPSRIGKAVLSRSSRTFNPFVFEVALFTVFLAI